MFSVFQAPHFGGFVFAIAAAKLSIFAACVRFCAFPLLIVSPVAGWKRRNPKRHCSKQLQTTVWRRRQSQKTVAHFAAEVGKPLLILDALSVSVANCVFEPRMATASLPIHPSQAHRKGFARFALGFAKETLNGPVNL